MHQVCKCTLYAYSLCRYTAHLIVKVQKVCVKSADAYLEHTFYKQIAYFMHTLECISI